MPEATPTKTRHSLSMTQQFELIKLVQAEYVRSGLNDVEFAKEASQELGFPVTNSNVAGVRSQFGIESNLKRAARTARENGACDAGLIAARVEEIAERITKLALVLERLIDRVGDLEGKIK